MWEARYRYDLDANGTITSDPATTSCRLDQLRRYMDQHVYGDFRDNLLSRPLVRLVDGISRRTRWARQAPCAHRAHVEQGSAEVGAGNSRAGARFVHDH